MDIGQGGEVPPAFIGDEGGGCLFIVQTKEKIILTGIIPLLPVGVDFHVALEAVPGGVVRRCSVPDLLPGPDGGVAVVAVEIDAVGSGMAEDPVQDDMDTQIRCFFKKPDQIFIGSQKRIDGQVITGVVAVVGLGLENGVEIEDGHPHGGEIGKFLTDAGQAASEKVTGLITVRRLARKIHFFVPGRVPDPLRPVHESQGTGFIKVLSPLEAVREDLVLDGPLHPVGGGKIRGMDRDLKAGDGFRPVRFELGAGQKRPAFKP